MGTVEGAARRLIERNVGVGPGSLANPSKFLAVMLKTGGPVMSDKVTISAPPQMNRDGQKWWHRCAELSNGLLWS
jgi:hypothetical protein